MPAHGKRRKTSRPESRPSSREVPGPASAPEEDEIEILEVVGVSETEMDVSGRDATGTVPAAVDELAQANRERDRYQDLLMRARADFENLQKRSRREMEELRAAAFADLVERLLPVLDNLDRALPDNASTDDPLRQGIRLIQQQLVEILVRVGLVPMDALGEPFDPQMHEAAEVLEVKGVAPGMVLEEMMKGYMFGEKLLRPALVKVSAERRADGDGSDTEPAT